MSAICHYYEQHALYQNATLYIKKPTTQDNYLIYLLLL